MRWRLKGLWQQPDFVKLWLGRTISKLGDGITGVAVPLTAILILSATPIQMGLLQAIGGIVFLLCGPLVGVWIDHLRRRPLMIIADLARALLLSTIPIAVLFGYLHMVQLYIILALVSIMNVFFATAEVSLLPGLIQAHELVEGNSKLGISDALAEIGGPGLAGVLVQIIRAPFALLIDALSFLCSALCLALIHKPEPVRPSVMLHQNFWHEQSSGIRFIVRNPYLRALALATGLFNFSGIFVGTLYALYVVRDLGASPTILGLLIATGGVSALIGAGIAERVIRRMGLGLVTGVTLFMYGIAGLLIPLAPHPLTWAITFLFLSQLIGDITISIHLIAELSLRQHLVPDHLSGRVNATMYTLTQGMTVPGALLAGLIAQWIGVRFTLLIGILGIILAGFSLLFSSVRKMQIAEEEPLA